MKHLRSLSNNNYAVLHLSRLLAISIPFLFITGVHIADAVGMEIPEILLDAVFGFFIIAIGVLIAIFGMSINLLTWFLIIGGLFIVFCYMYFQYVIDII